LLGEIIRHLKGANGMLMEWEEIREDRLDGSRREGGWKGREGKGRIIPHFLGVGKIPSTLVEMDGWIQRYGIGIGDGKRVSVVFT